MNTTHFVSLVRIFPRFAWNILIISLDFPTSKENCVMTTCFPSSNNQRDTATMLYSRVPLPGSYSETPFLPGNTRMYMNFLSHSDVHPIRALDSNMSRQETQSYLVGSSSADRDFSTINQVGGISGILQGEGRGLSLSLSTHDPSRMNMSSIQYLSSNPNFSPLLGLNPSILSGENKDSQIKQSTCNEYTLSDVPGSNLDAKKADIPSYGASSISSVVPNSKYLKAAQQLLDEFVNVRQAIMEQHIRNETAKETDGESGNGNSNPSAAGTSSTLQPQESSSIFPIELSAAKKQDAQDKITKLLSMLDEVDRRYRQYYHQMQIVVSSFDVLARSGAAKPYTALALKTISRHFRSLYDAIDGQIHVARKSLGEEDSPANSKGARISRLRYVDQLLKQQRALQQLGMMQPHAWRTQRGLPESSVSILRAWLFEHFLHPFATRKIRRRPC